jgi:hypothetical protein
MAAVAAFSYLLAAVAAFSYLVAAVAAFSYLVAAVDAFSYLVAAVAAFSYLVTAVAAFSYLVAAVAAARLLRCSVLLVIGRCCWLARLTLLRVLLLLLWDRGSLARDYHMTRDSVTRRQFVIISFINNVK